MDFDDNVVSVKFIVYLQIYRKGANNIITNYNFFPSCKHREEVINKICKKYSFVQCETIGESLCKRPIQALTIGNKENRALFAGAFHGMEWLTTLLLLRFFDNCCDAYVNKSSLYGFKINRFLKRRGLTVIPCINPDGVEIQLGGSLMACEYHGLVQKIAKNTAKWQANARGVDLNHNFDAGWQQVKELEIKGGILGPSPTRYGGVKPFSEPETQCLSEYCKKEKFRHALAFHSQGREIYYDYGENTPVKGLELAKVFSKVSGYEISHPQGIAVGGGFKDWFIEYFHKPGFTIEIGYGKNPLPISDFDEEYKMLSELLCYATIA